MSRKALPLLTWIEFRLAREDDGTTTAFTTGMEALGHREFEVRGSRTSPREVFEVPYDAANYVLEHGPILKHRQTFGRTAEERLNITHGKSMHPERKCVVIIGM